MALCLITFLMQTAKKRVNSPWLPRSVTWQGTPHSAMASSVCSAALPVTTRHLCCRFAAAATLPLQVLLTRSCLLKVLVCFGYSVLTGSLLDSRSRAETNPWPTSHLWNFPAQALRALSWHTAILVGFSFLSRHTLLCCFVQTRVVA